jgi:hypothetical protein
MGLKYIFSPLDIITITPILKMARKVNPWMEHLKKFRAANKGMNNKLIFAAAKKTYKQSPKQIGGAVIAAMSPAAMETAWAGGKKRSTKRRTKRSGRGSKRSAKRGKRSAKRSTKRSGGGELDPMIY